MGRSPGDSVWAHYESQTEDEAVTEDEAGVELAGALPRVPTN